MKLYTRVVFAIPLLIAASAFGGAPEFDGQCAMALSEGNSMPTDCKVVWISPEDKIYCFANQFAKRRFLEAPQANLKRAQASWEDPEFWKKVKRQQ